MNNHFVGEIAPILGHGVFVRNRIPYILDWLCEDEGKNDGKEGRRDLPARPEIRAFPRSSFGVRGLLHIAWCEKRPASSHGGLELAGRPEHCQAGNFHTKPLMHSKGT